MSFYHIALWRVQKSKIMVVISDLISDHWSVISDYDGDQWFSALQDMILYIALSEVLWAIPALVKCCMCFTNGFDELFANVKPSIGYSDCDSLD